jgi:hypothetical protein
MFISLYSLNNIYPFSYIQIHYYLSSAASTYTISPTSNNKHSTDYPPHNTQVHCRDTRNYNRSPSHSHSPCSSCSRNNTRRRTQHPSKYNQHSQRRTPRASSLDSRNRMLQLGRGCSCLRSGSRSSCKHRLSA